MRVIMLAAPGAGKGTQADRIAERFGITHFSTGQLLRDLAARGGPTADLIADFQQRGDLVPDDVLVDALKDQVIDMAGRQGGYVLDGFPRSLEQGRIAYLLGKEHGLLVDAVLNLEVDDDELWRRLRERGDNRPDDTPDVIAHRLQVYREKTEPLLDFYRERGVLRTIDGQQPIDQVTADIFSTLDGLGPRAD